MTGGRTKDNKNQEYSTKAYIVDIELKEFSLFFDINFARWRHACSTAFIGTTKTIVVIAAGENEDGRYIFIAVKLYT